MYQRNKKAEAVEFIWSISGKRLKINQAMPKGIPNFMGTLNIKYKIEYIAPKTNKLTNK